MIGVRLPARRAILSKGSSPVCAIVEVEIGVVRIDEFEWEFFVLILGGLVSKPWDVGDRGGTVFEA